MEFTIKHKKDLITHEVEQVNVTMKMQASDMAEGAKQASLQAVEIIRNLGSDDKKTKKIHMVVDVERLPEEKTLKIEALS